MDRRDRRRPPGAGAALAGGPRGDPPGRPARAGSGLDGRPDPPHQLTDYKMVLDEGASTPSVLIQGNCGCAGDEHPGPGLHEVEVNLDAPPAEDFCHLLLSANFSLQPLDPAGKRRSVSLENIAWLPGGREGAGPAGRRRQRAPASADLAAVRRSDDETRRGRDPPSRAGGLPRPPAAAARRPPAGDGGAGARGRTSRSPTRRWGGSSASWRGRPAPAGSWRSAPPSATARSGSRAARRRPGCMSVDVDPERLADGPPVPGAGGGRRPGRADRGDGAGGDPASRRARSTSSTWTR